ncbi:uncharacterized protein PG986_006440 [Apiospora aurea]|uniref:Uncharacterized protein n=1 Tax=Apiospora aurea TaxID=335848 RepID=A0ABR1QKF6_9PEZI
MVNFNLLSWLGAWSFVPRHYIVISNDNMHQHMATGDAATAAAAAPPVSRCYGVGLNHNITISIPRSRLFDRGYNHMQVPVWAGSRHNMSPRDNMFAVLSFKSDKGPRNQTTSVIVPYLSGTSNSSGDDDWDGYVEFEFGITYGRAKPGTMPLSIELVSPEDPWHRLPRLEFDTYFDYVFLPNRGPGGRKKAAGGGILCPEGPKDALTP